ncbi:hypothetical protein M422DRAFT_239449 [Sphaerobolus stellatus SS14]|nr:hypothetical protein M422DRAFT_239449 [Sphaerobolus stellatus SS14]
MDLNETTQQQLARQLVSEGATAIYYNLLTAVLAIYDCIFTFEDEHLIWKKPRE